MDGLDESRDRHNILDLLARMYHDRHFERIKIIAVSRKELDIERAFERVTVGISLSNPLVDEDIRKYIDSQLRSDPELSRWPQEVRLEIEEALANGAKGM